MIEKFNISIFKYINHFAGVNNILDIFAVIAAKYLVFVFILWLFYLWLKKEKKYKIIALYSGYSVALGMLLNSLISFFYYHPRPFMIPVGILLVHHVPESSFPSGHTTFTLSIALMLVYFKETRSTGLILSILGFVVGLARIFCGVHFPMDIIGSIGVALVASFIIYLLKNKLEIFNRNISRVLKIDL